MGFEFGNNSAILRLEIDGQEYSAVLDRPEFIDFWRNNYGRFSELAKADNPKMARDVVTFGVDMVTALLGVEVSRQLFEGREVSLTEMAALIGYIMGEIENQGLNAKLNDMTAKYGSASILR